MLLCFLAFACSPWSDADLDGDGVAVVDGDCDDSDPLVFPGASDEDADGMDQDCDGVDGPPECPWIGRWIPMGTYCGEGGEPVDVSDAFEETIGRVELEMTEGAAGCEVAFVAERTNCSEVQLWSMEPLESGALVLTFGSVECEGDCECDLPAGQWTTQWEETDEGLRLGPIDLPRSPCPVVFDLVEL